MKQRTALRLLAAGAVITAVSGAALAQTPGEDFKHPLRGNRAKSAQSAQNSRSTMVMRQDDGDNTVELRIEDGQYSAKLNGKDVPPDRIVRQKDEVRILDKDGNTVSTFHISTDGDNAGGQPPGAPKAPRGSRGGGGGKGAGGAAAGGGSWSPLTFQPGTPPGNPPKVMLGITMNAPSDELLKNYSLNEGDAILVQSVIEGLPADKAGLKANDIITEIDGKKPVNQETLRDILKTKEPGDTVEFTVLRKGGDKSIRITLDKYDQEKLGVAMNVMPGGGNGWVWNNGEGGDDAGKLAEKAMRDAFRGHIFTLPGQGQGFVMGGHNPDMDKKLADLDEKMADLDKKLQRVDEQMTKLQALIEKLSEQRSKK
jgi:hypothetical protein